LEKFFNPPNYFVETRMTGNQNALKNRAHGMSSHETLFAWRYKNGEEESKEEG
jgi:hypothetical protein